MSAKKLLRAVREAGYKYRKSKSNRNSMFYSIYRKGGSKSGLNTYENILIDLVNLDERIKRDKEAYTELYHKAEALINDLPDTGEREILTRRYLKGEYWDKISEQMKLSDNQTYQLFSRAIKNIEKISESRQ